MGRAISAPELSRPSSSPELSSLERAPVLAPPASAALSTPSDDSSSPLPPNAVVLSGKLQTANLGTASVAEQEERAKRVSKLKAPTFGSGGKPKAAGAKKLGARKLKISSGATKLNATPLAGNESCAEAPVASGGGSPNQLDRGSGGSNRLAEAYQSTAATKEIVATSKPLTEAHLPSSRNPSDSIVKEFSGNGMGHVSAVACQDKYKNAKAISSDHFFEQEPEDHSGRPPNGAAWQTAQVPPEFSGKKAISSDMFFNAGV